MAGLLAAVMKELPIGYGFRPTDEELLDHYLKRKNLGEEEAFCIIPEVDLCTVEPAELRRKFTDSSIVQLRDPECWFFCEQEPGRTHKRTTNRGFWKVTSATRDLKSRHGKHLIGSKNILTYYLGSSSDNIKTDWVMHEYHLLGDGLFQGNRKKYVLCMIKCKADENPDSSPSYEFGRNEPMTNVAGPIVMEPDHGSIPENLVQATVPSLEQPLCRTSGHGLNSNLPPVLPDSVEHSNGSADSSNTLLPLDSHFADWDFPFYANEESTDIFNILQDGRIYETWIPNEQQSMMMMENKQMQKVESLHGFVPVDEKKCTIEDDVTQPPAAAVRTETPKATRKKEYPEVLLCVPSESEDMAQKLAPRKIKEEILSAGSSSVSICKPRIPAIRVEGHTDAASSTKKKEIITMAVPDDRKKPAIQLNSTAAKTKPVSYRLTHCGRECSCNNQWTTADTWILLVCFVFLGVIFANF